MELIFSILAWVSVLLFQVVVHWSFARRPKRMKDEKKEQNEQLGDKNANDTTKTATNNEPATSTTTTTTTSDDGCPASPASVREQVLLSLCASSNTKEKEADAPLDGDEPEEFFQLLSQTGSEMARSWHSHETLIQQQLEIKG